MRFVAVPLAALFLGVSAFRTRTRKSARKAGQIDGLFPFGSPGPSEPGLENARGGPCFPGVRSANVQMRWYGQEADTATTVTGVLGFRHPRMDLQLNDLMNSSHTSFHTCDSEVRSQPRGFSKVALHDWQLYADEMQDLDLGWGNLMYKLTQMALPLSYEKSKAIANQSAQAFGYDCIGSALDGGGDGYVGEQVSHLFQDQSSKECILTFQGSSAFEDWVANLNVNKVRWCGLESLVHQGFMDALMAIVRNSDWQSDIKPKLSSCSKVYVTGHSQGGAQAELLAACVQKAPGRGQDGYDDYQFMEF